MSTTKPSTAPVKKTTKKKQARNVPAGIVFVKATFNNTIIAITDPRTGCGMGISRKIWIFWIEKVIRLCRHCCGSRCC